MGRLSERLTTARRTLSTLVELPLAGGATLVERDAAIQRFEYSFEAVWKASQQFLRDHEGLDPASPKATVHTYNEALAQMIYARLAAYAAAMTRWVDAMDSRLSALS